MKSKFEEELKLSFAVVLDTIDGRRVLSFILNQSPAPIAVFVPQKADETAVNCGKLSVTEPIRDIIMEINPSIFKTMGIEWKIFEDNNSEKQEDI